MATDSAVICIYFKTINSAMARTYTRGFSYRKLPRGVYRNNLSICGLTVTVRRPRSRLTLDVTWRDVTLSGWLADAPFRPEYRRAVSVLCTRTYVRTYVCNGDGPRLPRARKIFPRTDFNFAGHVTNNDWFYCSVRRKTYRFLMTALDSHENANEINHPF